MMSVLQEFSLLDGEEIPDAIEHRDSTRITAKDVPDEVISEVAEDPDVSRVQHRDAVYTPPQSIDISEYVPEAASVSTSQRKRGPTTVQSYWRRSFNYAPTVRDMLEDHPHLNDYADHLRDLEGATVTQADLEPDWPVYNPWLEDPGEARRYLQQAMRLGGGGIAVEPGRAREIIDAGEFPRPSDDEWQDLTIENWRDIYRVPDSATVYDTSLGLSLKTPEDAEDRRDLVLHRKGGSYGVTSGIGPVVIELTAIGELVLS